MTVIQGPWPSRPTPEEARLAVRFIAIWRQEISPTMTEADVLARLVPLGVHPEIICKVWPVLQWAQWDARRRA